MMDTLEIYVKQCWKAEEIQKEWKPQYGDYIWKDWSGTQWLNRSSFEILEESCQDRINELLEPDDVYPERGVPKIWWLPRQDELQGMIAKHGEKSFALLEMLWNWWIKSENCVGYCESLEQLWLAFVMKEKFGKVWNGEDWIRKE
ncbi:MAG: hypothetical protein A2Z69_00325 [Bacteroidetes bacterium RBG_13_44_24]|nr:MAG: hypothetical protein A2Z69_00325 [Bacteroidetes bacterium RBG_13_44_24]